MAHDSEYYNYHIATGILFRSSDLLVFTLEFIMNQKQKDKKDLDLISVIFVVRYDGPGVYKYTFQVPILRTIERHNSDGIRL